MRRVIRALLRVPIHVKNTGVKYATDVGVAIEDDDVATAAVSEEHVRTRMAIDKTVGVKLLHTKRD